MSLTYDQQNVLRELWYKHCSEMSGGEKRGASAWMAEIRSNKEDNEYIQMLFSAADEEDYKDPEISRMLRDLKSFSMLF